MRIAHLVSHPTLNGVATSTKMLIDAQLRAGHQVMLVHQPNAWIAQQDFAGPVDKLETSFKTSVHNLRNTGYPIRDWGRTLVHAHGSRANKAAMIFRLADGVPVVMTAHARLFQIPWRFAHEVIGLSRQTMRYYKQRFLISPSRMHNVPNMFDPTRAAPVDDRARAAARAKLGIRLETFLLGAVGAIGWRKRQTDMVRILRGLVLSGYDVELLLVGGDTAEPDFRKLLDEAVADPVVAGRVHRAGYRTDAMALLPAIDLYLCTSAVEEAPIAPLEAMAAAIPLITTDVGNIGDVAPAASVFPIGSVGAMTAAAIELMEDPERRSSQALDGRRLLIEKLSPESILPRIEAVYRSAVARARDRGVKYFKIQALAESGDRNLASHRSSDSAPIPSD